MYCLCRLLLFLLFMMKPYGWYQSQVMVPMIVVGDWKYIVQDVGDGRQLVTEILELKKLKLFVDS